MRFTESSLYWMFILALHHARRVTLAIHILKYITAYINLYMCRKYNFASHYTICVLHYAAFS